MSQLIISNPNQAQAAKPSHSAWVTASAGTGKTKLLTDRVLNLLLTGAKAPRVLCLTFTKHAASEMRTRIEAKLERWSHCEVTDLKLELLSLLGRSPSLQEIEIAQALFSDYLNSSRKFNIQTIHAFCLQLLQEFPIEAGLAPGFSVLDDLTTRKWWQEIYATLVDDPKHTNSWYLLWQYYTAEQIIEIASQFCQEFLLAVTEDASTRTLLTKELGITEGVAQHANAPLEAFCQKLAAKFSYQHCEWHKACKALATGSVTDQKLAAKINELLLQPSSNLASLWQDLLELALTQKWEPRKQLYTKKFADHPTIASLLPAWQNFCLEWLDDYRNLHLLQLNLAAAEVFVPMARSFAERKKAFNYVDYNDIISLTADLLTKPDHLAWISYKLDNTIEHILVDEAQDTSPSQWQIISTIAEEFFANQAASSNTKTILVVGDAKQSIFSFQGADPRYFAAARAFFANSAGNYQQKLVQLDLATSYRSAPAILHLVDKVFSGELARALAPELANISHIPHRTQSGGVVELWPLVVSQEDDSLSASWPLPGERARYTTPVEALAKMVASTIHKWLSERRLLTSKGRPIKPGDIMVLLRRRDPMQRLIIRELKRLHVPIAGSDRLLLTDHLAVQDVMALMQWLLISHDDLSLAIVLKSPWCGLTEEELADLCINREGSLWQRLQKKAILAPKLQEILCRLKRYQQIAAIFKADKFLSQLLEVEHGRALFAARLGSDIHEPLDELLALAARYCKENSGSLAGFLQLLHDHPIEVKRDLTEAGDAIRIMTAHGSKGLQAPVVLLPDTTSVASPHEAVLLDESNSAWPWALSETKLLPEKFVTLKAAKRQLGEQEYLRLLYVALTRAEDELYIMGTSKNGSISEDCWYSYCRNTLSNMQGSEEIASIAYNLPAGSAFEGKGYLYHIDTEITLSETPVSEPKVYTVGSSKDANPLDYPSWMATPSTWYAYSAPQLEEKPANFTTPIVALDKGIIIHALLEYGFNMDDSLLSAKVASYLERFHSSLDSGTHQEITKQLLMVLSHPVIKPLRFSKNVRREVPIIGKINGELVQGRIDLLSITQNELAIIDYKTGQRDQAALNKYHKQLIRYRQLLEPLYPTHKYSGYLLWTGIGIVEEVRLEL